MKRVSRNNLIASVPLVRIRDRVGVHVPLAIASVPVRVDGPDFVQNVFCATAH